MGDRDIAVLIDSSFDSPRTKKRHKRFHIKLNSDFVEGEGFPFKPGDKLIASIEGEKLVIEKL